MKVSNRSFDKENAYYGDDLGAVYSKDKTEFKVWAPTAKKVSLKLYEKGDGDNLIEAIPMKSQPKGIWFCEKTGDLNGVYYTYLIEFDDRINETVDIYAKAVGVNGNRGMIVDLKATNPDDFENDIRPIFKKETDAIIYELHIRDLTVNEASGVLNKGKFLGLTEKGTINESGLKTGLDHIVDLGVTHVQLLPCFDYASVDESRKDIKQYNWGYDPKNYNVPEGSYSINAYDGAVRINEMKKLIQTFHANGIRVNMDVVYNHTYDAEESWFQKTVPDYYYRKKGSKYSNGSGCGNETASDRAMMRKFMIDSVTYWAREYHIDGFRFDLMAVHDIKTMKEIRKALNKIDASIMVYGEGWTGGECALSSQKQALKTNINKMNRIGAFNDDIRDAIKGSVFNSLDKGFISGKTDMEESIKFGVVGAVSHAQVSRKGWASKASQSINYISCHDNLTFWDKLCISNANDSLEDRIRMTKLGAAIIFMSQGISFLQAGEELLRSKPDSNKTGAFVENSYASPDFTNSIKWNEKSEAKEVYEYYKGLISFRKLHKELRMSKTADIQKNIVFLQGLQKNVVAFIILEKIMVIFNANRYDISIQLPKGEWMVYINADKAGVKEIDKINGEIKVSKISAMVLENKIGNKNYKKDEK